MYVTLCKRYVVFNGCYVVYIMYTALYGFVHNELNDGK